MVNPFEEILLRLDEIQKQTSFLMEQNRVTNKNVASKKEWMTINEVMTEYKLSRTTIYKYMRNGTLHYNKFGGKTMVSRDQMKAFIEGQV
ncbi:helix-turn-helix domain-containing protein [Flammeovirga yaeyamensis]|uniref:Helix-turn-helix domain-containing protein n=1 Tax=Flammeovirga yaeyamensis TaxID=367791 RepID=A0AAX1N2Z6_9BACT|nr:helix-turn-helix domain-containing protein [Flammeovirga yaeyamensis]MBB3695969.1 excisionase family DNA binding protein [Flammeovirga yaeyamensis]NMF34656.1 helix-turn-helix domain-containing protein [Flammeovirga yaeyamensis]QWG00515.1 helix-turn-helix domain-containing protein [Flammeovirga yaeyamensis]